MVYYSAVSWSPPCNEYAPTYKKMSENEEITKMATLYCCDNDDYPDAEKKYEINAFPTFKFYRNGEVNDEFIQGADLDLVKEKIKKLYDEEWCPEYKEVEETPGPTPEKPKEGDEADKEGEEGKDGNEGEDKKDGD